MLARKAVTVKQLAADGCHVTYASYTAFRAWKRSVPCRGMQNPQRPAIWEFPNKGALI